VSIGATLAAARRHAGLTVADVSERTRVREPIIQGIEHDDYAACGGDFYARGHIRAIAEAVGSDPGPLIEEFDERWQSSPELTAAEVFQPSMPLRKRERHRMRWLGFLAVLVLAILGFAIYKFASGAGHARPAAAVSSPGPTAGGTPAAASASAASVRASTGQASTAQVSPTAASSAPPRALIPVSVAAFGPDGTGNGDDPQRAAGATGASSASAWSSDWYTTAYFGNLQAGTGLLLDMGRAVTVTSVRLSLSHARGADLQLRVGRSPVLADLRAVASRSGAGGNVQLPLGAPVHARYLLIWFTKLPPDPSGTYQVSVYKISVQGHP